MHFTINGRAYEADVDVRTSIWTCAASISA